MGIVRRRALFHRSSCSRSRRGRRDSSGLAACEDAKLGEMLFMCMTMNGVRKRITEDVRLGCDKAVSCKSVSKSDSTLRPDGYTDRMQCYSRCYFWQRRKKRIPAWCASGVPWRVRLL